MNSVSNSGRVRRESPSPEGIGAPGVLQECRWSAKVVLERVRAPSAPGVRRASKTLQEITAPLRHPHSINFPSQKNPKPTLNMQQTARGA